MFPCFNDRETIITLVRNARKTISTITDDYEIIVVDDASIDDSAYILKEEEGHNKYLKVIVHNRNMGYGRTILDGIAASTKEYFFYTDGDGQYDVREIINLIGRIGPDTVLVNGFKKQRSDPWYRILIGDIYNLLMKVIFHIKLSDIDCDFRIIRRDVLNISEFYSSSGTICVEMVKRIEMSGREIREAPVNHYYREYGTSQFFNMKRLLRVFVHLIYVYYLLMIK